MAHDKHDTKEFHLSESPGHLLHRAQQFAAERFTKAMAGAKLTQRQFAVLHATAEEEGLTQTQLVKSTGIDRSTLAELVARMVKNGLLEREKLPDDARANAVKLTDDGQGNPVGPPEKQAREFPGDPAPDSGDARKGRGGSQTGQDQGQREKEEGQEEGQGKSQGKGQESSPKIKEGFG